MTRLLINLFFIIVICFSLAAMPINTKVLQLFDLDKIFNSKPEVVQEKIIEEPNFEATYDVNYSLLNNERIYNPSTHTINLTTNIETIHKDNYTFEDLKLVLYKNEKLYKSFNFNKFVSNYEVKDVNGFVEVLYNIDLNFKNLDLSDDGFYLAVFSFKDKSIEESKFNVAFRSDIDYVSNGIIQNNGNFIYKSYFLNEDETYLVPLYFSVQYPNSITVEVRDRLYQIPPVNSGLSQLPLIPNKTSLSKIDKEYYGVFLRSDEMDSVILDNEKAKLATDALIKSLTRLPHISKLSFYVNEQQKENGLFDFDLSKVYENTSKPSVYLTESNSTNKRYLIPVELPEANIYDTVWSMFSILKSGDINNKEWSQIIPPELEIKDFTIEGTTITVDFNENILAVYDEFPEYQALMINSILYSLTSIENITKVIFTANGEPVTQIGEFDLSEPVGTPLYINFIGEY